MPYYCQLFRRLLNMSSKISNTTSLTFEYGVGEPQQSTASATATATMNESISISVTTVEKSYYAEESIIYLITIINNGPKIKDLTLTNNLGSYVDKQTESNNIAPLNYEGPSCMYINGALKNLITPEIKPDKIIFSIPSIPEKSDMLIICKMVANQSAPLSLDSKIKTITSLKTLDSQNSYETSHTIPVSKKANLKICKTITPQVFSQGETISYNITLYNYGNTAAKNIKINDIFTPAPTLTGVTIDENEISPSDYSYINGIFKLPAYGSEFNLEVPSANFETDNNLGTVSITPGVTNITITGVI